jgi:hypothetical protein
MQKCLGIGKSCRVDSGMSKQVAMVHVWQHKVCAHKMPPSGSGLLGFCFCVRAQRDCLGCTGVMTRISHKLHNGIFLCGGHAKPHTSQVPDRFSHLTRFLGGRGWFSCHAMSSLAGGRVETTRTQHNPDQWGFGEWLGQTPRLV